MRKATLCEQQRYRVYGYVYVGFVLVCSKTMQQQMREKWKGYVRTSSYVEITVKVREATTEDHNDLLFQTIHLQGLFIFQQPSKQPQNASDGKYWSRRVSRLWTIYWLYE